MMPPAIEATQQRYALCIGVNASALSQMDALRYAQADAEAMHALLLTRDFAPSHTQLLLGEQASIAGIIQALQDLVLSRPRRQDLVLVYFAGHGVRIACPDEDEDEEVQSDVFLVSASFDLQSLKRDRGAWMEYPLRLSNLRTRFFEQTRSRKVLFLLDSCHSGDFFGKAYRSLPPSPQESIQSSFAHMVAGRVVLSSCMPQQKAYEDERLGHGRFTHYLLRALRGQERDATVRDGMISVGSLFKYLSDALPASQRPVKGGVEHGSFDLWYVPHFDERREKNSTASPDEHKDHTASREQFLRALFSDHQGFLDDRSSAFVGREQEQRSIWQHIEQLQATGGYVILSGQAGQGKSSLIAKLVEEYCTSKKRTWEQVAFHFIPFHPGPDHQVGLLRNLMARLILLYDLPQFYVASEHRPALRDFFPKVLSLVAARGRREVVFIDGLDQIEEETNGRRDLSFLPLDPPEGIVFVLGVRPDDTLDQLHLCNSSILYAIPPLSRADFELLLKSRQVQLEVPVQDQLYEAAQANALYLDLAAKEAHQGVGSESVREQQIKSLIEKLTDDPLNLFSLSIARLKRQPLEWREVIKPLLGTLLVAQEPLTLRSLRRILEVEDDQLRDALARVGGLLSSGIQGGQKRYNLYHLKLYEYLRQDETRPHKAYLFASDEEEGWHSRLASWCGLEGIEQIYQEMKEPGGQSQQDYALRHYVTHLYYARHWQSLFQVLNEAKYGQAKMRQDPSMRSYIQDLDLGRQAMIWRGWRMDEAVGFLPHLWRYTLLRCSLVSKADDYPVERFEALVGQRRQKEAIEIAELLTRSDRKAYVFLRIAFQLGQLSDFKHEELQTLIRAYEVINTIKDEEKRGNLCCEIGLLLAQLGQQERAEIAWKDAELSILSVEGMNLSMHMLEKLGMTLIQAKEWEHAERIIGALEQSEQRVSLLLELGQALVQAQEWKRAETIWILVEAGASNINESRKKIQILQYLSRVHIKNFQWEHAERIIGTLEQSEERISLLLELGQALVQAQEWKRAETIWVLAETLIQATEESEERISLLLELGQALVQAQAWKRAEAIWVSVEMQALVFKDKEKRLKALIGLSETLVQARLWEYACEMLEKVHFFISTLEVSGEKIDALRELSLRLILTHQWEQAATIWSESEILALNFRRDIEKQLWALKVLKEKLEEIKYEKKKLLPEEWAVMSTWRAIEEEEVAQGIQLLINELQENWKRREQAISKYSKTLIQMQQWEHAERIIGTLEQSEERISLLLELGQALVQAQEWKRAEAIWALVEAYTQTIERSNGKIEILCQLGRVLIQSDQLKRAETVIQNLDDSIEKAVALWELGFALIQKQQAQHAENNFNFAEIIISSLKNDDEKARALRRLLVSLIRAQQWERVNKIINHIDNNWLILDEKEEETILMNLDDITLFAERKIKYVSDAFEQNTSLLSIRQEIQRITLQSDYSIHEISEQALHQISGGRYPLSHRQEVIKALLFSEEKRFSALYELSLVLVQAQQWRSVELLWAKIEALRRARNESWERAMVLYELGKVLLDTGQRDKAKLVWEEMRTISLSIGNRRLRMPVLTKLHRDLIQGAFWGEAQDLIQTLEEDNMREAVCELSRALIQAQQWQRAEEVIMAMERGREKALALLELWQSLILAQQWERAEGVWEEAKKTAFILVGEEEQVEVITKLIEALIMVNDIKQAEYLLVIAIKKIHAFSNGDAKIIKFRTLWSTFAKAEPWERVRTTVYRLQDRWERAVALEALGSALAQANRGEQAQKVLAECLLIASTIRSSRQRTEALRELAKTLAKLGFWDQAERAALAIEHDWERATALRELNESQMARIMQWEKATIIAQRIGGQEGDKLLCGISAALIQTQQWFEAEWVTRAIEKSSKRNSSLRKLGQALARAQQWAKAKLVIDAIENSWEKVAALGELGLRLAEVQEEEQAKILWKEAETRAHALKESRGRVRALSELGKILVLAKQLNWAQRVWVETVLVISTMKENEKRADTLSDFCTILIQNQQWEHIASVLRSIDDKKRRAALLCDLSEGLAQVHRWERAESIAHAIEDKAIRAEAFSKLSRALVQAQQWKQAKRVAELILLEDLKMDSLQDFVLTFIKMHHWEKAEDAIWSIKSPEKRIELLKLLGNQLEAIKDYESLLHLVQRSWMKARTRAEALILLPFANGLISLKPEVGIIFYEAFNWVEEFLSR